MSFVLHNNKFLTSNRRYKIPQGRSFRYKLVLVVELVDQEAIHRKTYRCHSHHTWTYLHTCHSSHIWTYLHTRPSQRTGGYLKSQVRCCNLGQRMDRKPDLVQPSVYRLFKRHPCHSCFAFLFLVTKKVHRW